MYLKNILKRGAGEMDIRLACGDIARIPYGHLGTSRSNSWL